MINFCVHCGSDDLSKNETVEAYSSIHNSRRCNKCAMFTHEVLVEDDIPCVFSTAGVVDSFTLLKREHEGYQEVKRQRDSRNDAQ